jgi:hypothetical protein
MAMTTSSSIKVKARFRVMPWHLPIASSALLKHSSLTGHRTPGFLA